MPWSCIAFVGFWVSVLLALLSLAIPVPGGGGFWAMLAIAFALAPVAE